MASTIRRGTVAPFLAVMIVIMLALTAMAIDLGVMTMARAQLQNAADTAALMGARTLNGDVNQQYEISLSASRAKAQAAKNYVMSQPIDPAKVDVRTGVYTYNAALQRFEATQPSFTTATSGTSALGAWTASRVVITENVPVFFANVFTLLGGTVNQNPQMRAIATAVHRPRDIAIVLDFSGSMRFNSWSHYPQNGKVTGSLNPDPVWPKFGHYSRYVGLSTTGTANPMQRTTDFISGGENVAPNNITMFSTTNGPAVIGTVGNPDEQYWRTKSGASLTGAWYNDPSGGYNPNATPCAMPAPDSFEDQSSSGYLGDQHPRRNVSLNGTNWAVTAQEFLTGSNSTPSGGNAHIRSLVNGPGGGPFDPGPLVIDPPNSYAAAGTAPWPTAAYNTGQTISWYRNCGYGNSSGANKGYSMGPKYFGKTFWVWPPDPREPNGDMVNNVPESNYIAGDWRKRFFYYGSSVVDAAGINLGNRRLDDNNLLFDGNWLKNPGSSTYRVDYTAIIHWIKNTGPKVFPDNLRAGRLLYYDEIPNTIPQSGGSMDQIFWRAYINYVLGISPYKEETTLYGRDGSHWGTGKLTAKNSLFNRGGQTIYIAGAPGVTSSDLAKNPPAGSGVDVNRTPPYMQYNDNPRRPRAHFWFGPYTMLMFLTEASDPKRNMWPGTCSEAQTWQLKAAIQSAIDDIRRNHPNDWATLIYFSGLSQYNVPRVTLGQDYARMKNALWFPLSLLDQLGDPNAEFRPYNSSLNKSNVDGNVPHAAGSTCPGMGLKLAYNEFSSGSANSRNYSGRRGAAKMVILETDGVPNHSCNGTLNNAGPFISAYTSTAQIGQTNQHGNGVEPSMSSAIAVASQICALSSSNGYSTIRIPARVHAIAFGDLFEPDSTAPQKGPAMTFLTNIEIAGRTSPSGATSLQPYKVITGPFQTRIDNLRLALERIMQSGVQVSLVGSYGDEL